MTIFPDKSFQIQGLDVLCNNVSTTAQGVAPPWDLPGVSRGGLRDPSSESSLISASPNSCRSKTQQKRTQMHYESLSLSLYIYMDIHILSHMCRPQWRQRTGLKQYSNHLENPPGKSPSARPFLPRPSVAGHPRPSCSGFCHNYSSLGKESRDSMK